ncbi:MAG: antitoxin [Cyanobacteria bacterium REEB67]|nr:antitoxin [Cyanobacteria bacterium REEB67]
MHITSLQKVGDSVMLEIPSALLEQLHLRADSAVKIGIEGDRIVIESNSKHRYTMAELLAASDYSQLPDKSEREWIDAGATGREIQ